MAAEVSVRAQLQANLNEFSCLTRQLLEGVSGDAKPRPGDPAVLSVPSIVDKLVERDKEIQQLVEKALEMRSCQKELERVEAQLEKRGQEMSELQARLQDAEKILELAVYHGRQKLQSISQSNEGAVTPEELIRYAHRISQASSTVSPVGWQPSDPRRPYPQDIEMRSGFLGGFTSPAPQEAQGKLTANGALKEPPEKKISLDAAGDLVMSAAGANQNNNKPPKAPAGFKMAFEDPEPMSEDTSSSSDEGT